jgi:hypothetical protein
MRKRREKPQSEESSEYGRASMLALRDRRIRPFYLHDCRSLMLE